MLVTARESLVSGSEALNRGDTESALEHFTKARDTSLSNKADLSKAEQMRGICLRMLDRFDEAEVAFKTAFELALGSLRRGHIKHDWAMVPLVQGDTERAMKLITESLELLSSTPSDIAPQQKHKRDIQYFASLGFRARVYAAMGEVTNARADYKKARKGLRGYAPYELSNVAWELKSATWWLRLALFPRALKLAIQARHKERCAQVVLLTFCRPLARKYEKR